MLYALFKFKLIILNAKQREIWKRTLNNFYPGTKADKQTNKQTNKHTG
jgi:hypothetical protein